MLELRRAGDPKEHVTTSGHAKGVVRSICDDENEELALEFVTRLGHDLQDHSCSPEVRSLGRTLLRWKHQIAA